MKPQSLPGIDAFVFPIANGQTVGWNGEPAPDLRFDPFSLFRLRLRLRLMRSRFTHPCKLGSENRQGTSVGLSPARRRTTRIAPRRAEDTPYAASLMDGFLSIFHA